jgi:hypothetical protein
MGMLLNKKEGKTSVNKDNYLPIELGNHVKKISNTSDTHLVDVYQVYLDEKDASDKYRLVFTINPVYSNVLFNAITEVVYEEGSPDCFVLPEETSDSPDKVTYPNIVSDEPITRIQAIRDTEYSNKNIMGLTYLPGIDIFNNHLIRQNGFNCIMKRSDRNASKTGVAYKMKDDFTFDPDSKQLTDVFNTIRDYHRTQEGKRVVKKFPGHDATYLNPLTGESHVYNESEILDFETTIRTRLKENNGWFGFYNPSTLDIPIGKFIDADGKTDNNIDIYVNKLLNDHGSCDFIDMFPDRSRFTFVPQKNKYRNNRLEKNWEYCLTYPYSTTIYLTDENGEAVIDEETGDPVLNDIVAGKDANGNVRNGLRFSVVGEYVTDSDRRRVLIQSVGAIHNLSPKDTINIYYPAGDDGKFSSDGRFDSVSNIQVMGLGTKSGEMQQYYFSIDSDDVPGWFDDDGKLIENGDRIDEDGNLVGGISGRFCKTVFGVECMYYFRVFRRLPNFNEILKDEDRAYYIKKYNTMEYDFNSEINKLAFAHNIYGDNIAQIVYLDDVDVNGITDNFERPLSDIYLTIVKANNGHELWYPEDGSKPVYADENITIARPFGKVTSGIDLPPEDGFIRDFNVHRIHNIKFSDVCGDECVYGDEYKPDETKENDTPRAYENLGNLHKNYKVISKSDDKKYRCGDVLENLDTLEDDIKIDREFFLGDMVEFSVSQYQETILEPVYHRFNTAQREYVSKEFKDIITDEIYMDDYEGSETGVTHNNSESIEGNFKCVETVYNQGYENILNLDVVPEVNERNLVRYPGNLFPEGYYYQPHYRIHLKDVSDKITQSSDTFMELTEDGLKTGRTGDEVTFTTARDYDLIVRDEIVIQDTKNNIFYDAIVTEAEGVTGETFARAVLKNGMRINEGVDEESRPDHFIVFKKTLGIPKYALHYPDTGGKYIWRSLVPHSKTNTDSEIYDKPFANGAHYRHVGINFFLRRQDPYGYYELNTKTDLSTGETNKLQNFMKYGNGNERIYYNDAIDFGVIDIC